MTPLRDLAIARDPMYAENLKRFFEKVKEPLVVKSDLDCKDYEILPYLVYREGAGWISYSSREDREVVTISRFIERYHNKNKPKKSIEELIEVVDKSRDPLNLVYQWVTLDKISYGKFKTLIDYIHEKQRRDYEMDGFQ